MKQPETPGEAVPEEAVKGIHNGPPAPYCGSSRTSAWRSCWSAAPTQPSAQASSLLLRGCIPGLPSPVVLSIAFVVSLVAVFFVYRKLVFRVRGHFWLDLGRFTLVNLTMFFTNMALLLVAHEVLGYPQIPSQIAITCVTVIINYFGHKYFSFRRSPEPASPKESHRGKHPMSPKVSIVIPAYNNVQYIEETLQSVLNQTFEDYEVVIADHSSIDGTAEMIARFADNPKVRVLTPTPTGGGAQANWNRVSQAATGEYLKLVCGDDLISPDALELQVKALEDNPGAVIVSSRRDLVDANGRLFLKGRGLQGVSGRVSGRDAIRATVLAGSNIFGEPACRCSSANCSPRKVGGTTPIRISLMRRPWCASAAMATSLRSAKRLRRSGSAQASGVSGWPVSSPTRR